MYTDRIAMPLLVQPPRGDVVHPLSYRENRLGTLRVASAEPASASCARVASFEDLGVEYRGSNAPEAVANGGGQEKAMRLYQDEHLASAIVGERLKDLEREECDLDRPSARQRQRPAGDYSCQGRGSSSSRAFWLTIVGRSPSD
jgi:hypothetical protein